MVSSFSYQNNKKIVTFIESIKVYTTAKTQITTIFKVRKPNFLCLLHQNMFLLLSIFSVVFSMTATQKPAMAKVRLLTAL